MKVTIDVEQDQVDAIVIQELISMLSCLKSDLKRAKESDRGHVFSTNKEEDIKEIKEHIKSFEQILNYYGESL